MSTELRLLFAEILAEGERAHAKHGDTSMRSQPWHEHRRTSILAEEVGEVARALNDRSHGRTDEETVTDLRSELIQTAAMVVDWIRALPPIDPHARARSFVLQDDELTDDEVDRLRAALNET